MKKLTVSIVTLFFVLFSSVFTASAEEPVKEQTNVILGLAKAKDNAYYYDSPNGTPPDRQLVKGLMYYVYQDSNASQHPDVWGVGTTNGVADWVLKKDGVFKQYAKPDGNRIGEFYPSIDAYVYKTPNIVPVVGKFNKGTNYNVYNYTKTNNGMFAIGGAGWVAAKDVDFTQWTSDKDTAVTTTTIGRVSSIDGDVTIYNDSKATATAVGTLKQNDFATTLEVKGKVNGYYNVGTNKWIAENPDKVRFFPPNTETDVYKFVYDARKWEGTKYAKWGNGSATNPNFDEIGFIFRNFKDADYNVGRIYVDAYEYLAKKVTKPHIGDLIFFKPDANGNRNVGIIVSEKAGKLKYVAATEQDGVKVSKFNTTDTNISGFGRFR